MNARSARHLIVQGDSLARAGRLHEAQEHYLRSIELVTNDPSSGSESSGDQAASIALTRAIGHERVGLVRTSLGAAEAADESFAESAAALSEGAAAASQDRASIIEELRVTAPVRWREAQRLRTEPPAVHLAMGTKLCEHGCLSKSGLCNGHPPDPCW